MTYLTASHKKFAVAAVATALVATAAIPVSAASFTDVSDRYEQAVNFLVDKKITEGMSTAAFGTEDSIKRVDTAIMLAKALEMDVVNVEASGFTDVPARAKAYVDALKAAKIVNGKTASSFAGNQEITRGEAALMLVKAYDLTASNPTVSFTDVGSRYEAAVAALIENKISTGKTATTFGTQQPITRGEFAIFIHRLASLEKEVAPVSVTVKDEAELKTAIGNKEVGKITLSEDITAKELPSITRNLELDLNGKTLIGDLKYEMPNEQKEVVLQSSQANGKLQGDLTVDTPKADFVVGENVEVTGTTKIVNVKESTFHNKGTLNAVDIQDADGTSFENHGQGAVKGNVAINTVGEVKLIGKMDSVEVNQAAKITVDAAATITKLNVKVADVVLTAPKGSVGTVEAAAGVVVNDSSGTQIETKPAVQPTPEYTAPPAVITAAKLIGDYEKLQKTFIENNPINEERYWDYYDLTVAREDLANKLKAKVLTETEKELLQQIDSTLDVYLVESYNPHVDEFDGLIDLHTSDGTGVYIEWASSHPEIVSAEGIVTKPAKGEEAVEVILTATITRNDASRVIEIPVLVEAITNPYVIAKSLTLNELAEYSKENGYIGNQVNVEINLEELIKDYPTAQQMKIEITNFMNEGVTREIKDIRSESTVIFKDELTIDRNSTMNSGNVSIKLLDEEGNELEILYNSIRIYNLYSDVNISLFDNRNTLTPESLVKYIPNGNSYTTEEKLEIIEKFKEIPEIYNVLEELQKIAVEVKEASTVK